MTESVLVYRVSEVCSMLRFSKSKAWRMIESGEMPVVRFGRVVRVPAAWVHEQLGRVAA